MYLSGKALTSGLGEHAADRAFADPDFLRARLVEAEAGRPLRANSWGRATIEWAEIEVRWAVTRDKAEADALERQVIGLLGEMPLWNRRR